MRFGKQTGLVAAALLLSCANTWADTISLPLTDDSFTNGVKPSSEYGLRDDISIHSYGPRQGLVRFDGASLAGLEINSATLTLYLNDIAAAGAISIHAITSSWNESTVNWENQPPAEATATAVVDLATADEGSIISIDVTGVVERWADGSLPDGGFLIVTTNNIKAYFDAKEMAGGVPATLTVDTGPAVSDGRAIVLDFTDPDNCEIYEPGHYILDRSWDFSPPNPQGACTEGIRAIGDTTIDLKGFTLKLVRDDQPTYFVETCGTIRGGTLIGGPWPALYSDGCSTTVIDMNIDGSVVLSTGVILNSEIHGTVNFNGLFGSDWVPGDAVIRDSIIKCSSLSPATCLSVHVVDAIEIRNNSISVSQPDGENIVGGINFNSVSDDPATRIVEGNLIRISGMSVSWSYGITLPSNIPGAIVARNTIVTDAGTGAGIRVSSQFNNYRPIIDSNIVLGPTVGIEFEEGVTGIYYGDNRVSAITPFVGTDGQTDWGGNVSF